LQSAKVISIAQETSRVKTIHFAVPSWPGHLAGQHVDVRLTAEDGYRAERSYSISSPPEAEGLTLTVERVDQGEVSPYLTDNLQPGDTIELRGPIGGHLCGLLCRGRSPCY
jgi:ferredoxin-NADP reductase